MDAAEQAHETDRAVYEDECRALTGLGRTCRWRLERSGAFPARRQFSPGRSGWLHSEIQAFLRTRPLGSRRSGATRQAA